MNMDTSDGYKQRKKLFDIFSNNVANVKLHPSISIDPDLDDVCVCPICMKLFPRDALSFSKGYIDPLTLEDVPPTSLGGKVLTLTCKICNNTAGSQLESHLKNRLDFEEAFKGKGNSTINGAIRTGNNISINASINIKEDKLLMIYFNQARSDPEKVDQFTTILNSGKTFDLSLDFFGKYKLNRPEVALLRIAYLIAFSTFGLGFILNPNLQLIRDQINNPKEKLLSNWGISRFDFPDNTLGINIIREPKELRAFFIVFELKTKNNKSRIGVFLPGPGKPGLDIYSYMENFKTTNQQNIDINAVHIFNNDYLSNSNMALASNDYWFDIMNNKKQEST